TDILNIHFKADGFTRQRVVGIDIRHKTTDFFDGYLAWALLGMHHSGHAFLPHFGTAQVLHRYALNGVSATSTIGLLRGQGYADVLAGSFAFQGFFKPRNHIVVAM